MLLMQKGLAISPGLFSSSPPMSFAEEAIFRDFMGYCNKLSVPLKQKYLEVYLSTELKKFLVESKVKNRWYREPVLR